MTNFFSNKKILVTGGCSFIGSFLVESLVRDGANITIVDDLSSGKLENIAQVKSHVKFIRGDLRDSSIVKEAVRDQEIVFHLANIHGGRGFIETHPGEICQNFLIDGNIFYQCYLNNIDRIVYVSSACVYPTNFQEVGGEYKRYLSEEMGDPFKKGCALSDGEYGWAKFMGEMSLKSYHKQFGVKGVSCRLFTVYGPRENESHAIIAFIAKALIKQNPYEVWGSGQQDRNFTFVDDIVDGLKLSCEKITDCRSVNIGTDEVVKIADAASIVCDILGYEPEDGFFYDITKPEGVHARAADTANQELWLGWRPKVSFRDGITKTIQWYLENTNIEKLRNEFQKKLFER